MGLDSVVAGMARTQERLDAASWAVGAAAAGRARELAEAIPRPKERLFDAFKGRYFVTPKLKELGLQRLDETLLSIRQAREAIAPGRQPLDGADDATRQFVGGLDDAEQAALQLQRSFDHPTLFNDMNRPYRGNSSVLEGLDRALLVVSDRIQRERHAALVPNINRIVADVRGELDALGAVGAGRHHRADVRGVVEATVGRPELLA